MRLTIMMTRVGLSTIRCSPFRVQPCFWHLEICPRFPPIFRRCRDPPKGSKRKHRLEGLAGLGNRPENNRDHARWCSLKSVSWRALQGKQLQLSMLSYIHVKDAAGVVVLVVKNLNLIRSIDATHTTTLRQDIA